MYEELVKALRNCVDGSCRTCPRFSICNEVDGSLLARLLNDAADAIEKLNRKVEDFEAMREISPEAEYAINKHVDNLISKLDKLINNSEDKPHWIPVTERLPEDKKETYWCYTDLGAMCECRWTNNRFGMGESDLWGWNIFDVPQYQKVTHWMPLPAPPKEET